MNPAETRAALVERLNNPRRPPLIKGKLVQKKGGCFCFCAQGHALRLAGFNAHSLYRMRQKEADRAVAAALGISLFHSVLLRMINDKTNIPPQNVFTDPEKVLGEHYEIIFAFARHIDRMTDKQFSSISDKVQHQPWYHAMSSASDAAGETKAKLASIVILSGFDYDISNAIAAAVNEIQGHKLLAEIGKPLLFLPAFGFATVDQILIEDKIK